MQHDHRDLNVWMNSREKGQQEKKSGHCGLIKTNTKVQDNMSTVKDLDQTGPQSLQYLYLSQHIPGKSNGLLQNNYMNNPIAEMLELP